MDFLDKVMNFHSNLMEEEKKQQSTPTVINDDKDIQKLEKKPRKKTLTQIFIIKNNYKKKK
tara:strand:+ start:1453 stop:1635 length:183 start_codon:yes stop_codon:yes gene_type:complete